MKLLLTSGGLSNKSIVDALLELTGKPFAELNLAFVPTAANVESGDKDWLINDLASCTKLGFKAIDIVDISAITKDMWLPRLQEADVLFFEGGNTYHLMDWLNKSGLAKLLPELLKDKVYVGVSAGSMVTNKNLALKILQIVYGEDLDKDYEMDGLKYVDFYCLPHLNSQYFANLREDFIRDTVKDMQEKIYVLDDESAIKIDGDKINVVSEEKWFEIN